MVKTAMIKVVTTMRLSLELSQIEENARHGHRSRILQQMNSADLRSPGVSNALWLPLSTAMDLLNTRTKATANSSTCLRSVRRLPHGVSLMSRQSCGRMSTQIPLFRSEEHTSE